MAHPGVECRTCGGLRRTEKIFSRQVWGSEREDRAYEVDGPDAEDEEGELQEEYASTEEYAPEEDYGYEQEYGYEELYGSEEEEEYEEDWDW
ncbi:hypothetical protein FGB62_175g07 [Gracilaria domingensis]|nr:hypothetical protein FGB62_175g07 [Gracilaria domingensis]